MGKTLALFCRSWTMNYRHLSHFLFGIGIILIIGNTIRLTTESHHQEIIILKLVGTTPSFIRRLLAYRGFFYSLSAGFLAWLNRYSLMLWGSSPLNIWQLLTITIS
ncbi:FtsX-like permease family protein [Candidatus Coxiella mudrowiae]|uniref:FtsX-like permease family protein n=1 Tax=Candidatus Coxiella mudrowiae TaxID=2054173 RepID=UPI0012FEDE71|nr:FtsX-like permease family protein [Candidatus Coxiella mudrowiae]